MQEVFEKIMEKLKEESFLTTNDDGETNEFSIEVVDSKDAIEIVKQATAEYNNGWIPVREKLPEEPESTNDVEDDIFNERLTEYVVMIKGAEKVTTLYYSGDGFWYDEVTQEYYPVTVWQPLPEPYQTEWDRNGESEG